MKQIWLWIMFSFLSMLPNTVSAAHGGETADPCPQCGGDSVELHDTTFEAGCQCECTATTSITLVNNVNVKEGARLTFRIVPDGRPVYVSIVLHYEESFVQSKPYFFQQRNKLLDLAQYLYEEGIPLNLGPDWAFMEAIETFEDDDMRETTGGKNILRYITEDLGHKVDPHAHEHIYNYADVAYMIKDLGVEPSRIASGLIVDPPQDSKYDYLCSPIDGNFYDYTWQAQWLWGDATANHVNDTTASGIWRPKDQLHFYENDDGAPLPCIGKYINDIDGVYDLIEKIATDEVEQGHMYTAAIFIPQGRVTEALEELQTNMTALKQYEASGQLRFVSLQGAAEIWQDVYSGEGYVYIP